MTFNKQSVMTGGDTMDIHTLRQDENFEVLAAKVHNGWWREKRRQGFHAPWECTISVSAVVADYELENPKFIRRCESCHADMYPYGDLSEGKKEYDRATVRVVLDAIEEL